MNNVNEKKWRRFVNALDIVTTVIAIIIADIVAEMWFNGKLIPELIAVVVIVLIFTPVRGLIEKAVYRNEKLRKKFE